MVDLFYYRTVNLNEEVKKEDEERGRQLIAKLKKDHTNGKTK